MSQPTLTTLASFPPDIGQGPYTGLTADAAGDLFGTTEIGGSAGGGTVFELVKGASTVTTLASFTGGNGVAPRAGLTADAAGDLFGTTDGGGSAGAGTVFEVAKGASTVTVLANFTATTGEFPTASVIADAAGDLFGTTSGGGSAGGGTVFELVKGASTVTTLASLTGSNGPNLFAGLTADAAGDLFGTTVSGGSASFGTVFELVKGASTLTTLVSFTGGNGGYPYAGLTADAAGDLFGTTTLGGSVGYGTVFELVKGATSVTTLANFTLSNGAAPYAGLIVNAAGDLFGTTVSGGSGGDGTVFELVKGASTVTTLVSFTGSNGAHPYAGLTADAAGDLFGTTLDGGSAAQGTVFELTNAGFVVPPTISGGTATHATTSEVPVSPFSGVTVGDRNIGATDTLTISLGGAGGTLSGAGLSGGTGGVYTLTNSAGAVTSALDALVFTPAAGQPNAISTTTFSLSDKSTDCASATLASFSVTDADPAVAPTISGGIAVQTTTSEAAVAPFAGVTISDTNSGGTETLTISLGGAGGTLSGAGLSGGTGGVYTITNSARGVTSSLDTLTFKPAAGQPNTSGTTTLSLSDKSTAFTVATTASFSVTSADPAVAPAISGGIAVLTTTSEAPVAPFAGVTIIDANSGATETVTISLGGAGGTLSGAGLSGGSSGVYTLTGPASAVTSALEALTFTATPGQPNTSATTTLSLSDKSTAFASATLASFSVIDTDPTVAPTISGGTAVQTTTSEAPVAPFAGVTISDANSGATDMVTISLGGTDGTLSGAGLSGGTGRVYTLTGLAGAVTSALDALTFTPSPGQPNTSATTTFSVSDKSTAFASATLASFSVTDADPAVAPTISGGIAVQTTTSEAAVAPFAGVTISDANSGGTETLTISLGGAGGTLSGAGLSGGTGGVYTITNSARGVTSALDTLTFKPAAGQPNTSGTTTLSLSDKSTAFTVATTASFSVTNADPAVAPAISGGIAVLTTTSEAPVAPFADVTISDANSGATDTVTISLGGAGGTLSGAGLSGGSSGVYTLTGSAAAVTGELDALSFTAKPGQPGTSGTTTFTLSDTSTAGKSVTGGGFSVVNTDPAQPIVTPATAPAATNASAATLGTAIPAASGDTLSVKLTSDAAFTSGSSVTLSGGSLIYQPGLVTAAKAGPDQIGYTVTDTTTGAVTSETQIVSLSNGPAPVVTLASSPAATNANPVKLGTAIAGFGGDALSVTLTGDSVFGIASASVALASGTITYKPGTITSANAGPDTIGYTVTDTITGAFTAETQTVTLQPPAPVFTAINATGYGNVINVYAGNAIINAGAGNATVNGGDGNLDVTFSGYGNTMTAGNGNDIVSGSQGYSAVTLGNGNDVLSMGGYGNTITAGNGNDTVSGSQGNTTVMLGGGNDSVSLAGYNNTVTLGAGGTSTVSPGAGYDSVTAGPGNTTVLLQGYGNTVSLGAGANTIVSGAGYDTIQVSGGTANLTFSGLADMAFLGGASATITDTSSYLTLAVAPGGTDVITGFGAARGSVIDLMGGAGGFRSTAAVVQALTSDGHSGTLLTLGATSSIDFTGLTPGALTVANFRIG